MGFGKKSGFTLVELLIANALGLFLLIALVEVYVTIKSTYQFQTALATMQENGRFAINFLNQNIRMAGYAGCENPQAPVINEGVLQGYQVSGNDQLLIKECFNTQDKNNKFTAMSYFIADTHRKNQAGETIYALYEKAAQGNRRELVSGIEAMKIEYGILQPNKTLTYVKQAQVNNWNAIRIVKIKLLINSIENVLQKPQAYQFANVTVTPTDRMLHKEWDTYIALRERINSVT